MLIQSRRAANVGFSVVPRWSTLAAVDAAFKIGSAAYVADPFPRAKGARAISNKRRGTAVRERAPPQHLAMRCPLGFRKKTRRRRPMRSVWRASRVQTRARVRGDSPTGSAPDCASARAQATDGTMIRFSRACARC